MGTTQSLRRAAPLVLAVAVVLSLIIFGSGDIFLAVCAVGGLLVALVFVLTRQDRDRAA